MSKTVLIALLVIVLAGGGVAFAQLGPAAGLLGLDTVPPEIEDEESGREFGEGVSGSAREIDPSDFLPEAAEVNNGGDAERSAVAEAVLEVLGDEASPGDNGAGFGEAVSGQATEDGRALGENVADEAQEQGTSIGDSVADQAREEGSSVGDSFKPDRAANGKPGAGNR